MQTKAHLLLLGNPDVDPILSIFADGTDGFYFDFSKTDRTFQGNNSVPADDAGESVCLALDWHTSGGRGVVNLFAYTQQLDNGAWTKAACPVTANAVAAPDGTTTADKLVPTAANTTHGIYQQITPTNGTTYTFSVYAKAAEYTKLLLCDIANGRAGAWFDLATGATISSAGFGFVSSSIQAVGGGWYRCSMVFTATALSFAASVVGYLDGSTPSASGVSFLGDASSGIYAWGAQIEAGASPSTYQPNAAALGGPGNHGLQTTSGARPTRQAGGLSRYDGVDDNLLTTLTPSTSANTLLIKFKQPVGNDNSILIGAQGAANTRLFLGVTTAGLISGGVGSLNGLSIKGAANIANTVGVAALTHDASTVRLYWNGVEVDADALSGTPSAAQPIAIGAWNNNGTVGAFAAADIYYALAIKKALTAAQIQAITNLWGTT